MDSSTELLLRILIFLLGLLIVVYTITSALRTFVLPRPDNVWISRQIFQYVYRFFLVFTHYSPSYEKRDRVLAFFGPTVLLIMPVVYLGLLIVGYTPIYWALGAGTLYESMLMSGSSLLTLGYAAVRGENIPLLIVSFTDAAIGMIMVALLIAYLPTIYSAFSQRERLVSLLEVRAGSPPSAVTMLLRLHRNRGTTADLAELCKEWERWFAEIEENHTSLVVLVFFRSPQPEHSWITAAGAVLDSAALLDAVVDVPRSFEVVVCIRAGYIALRRIADFFQIAHDPNPKPDAFISISRAEFDEAVAELAAGGIPLKADLNQAWRDFVGWRVNYDRVLVALARLTAAPYAPWSSDRSMPGMERIAG